MNHDPRFPIEPLSDEDWQRIEQRLFAPTASAQRAAQAAPARARPALRVWQLGFAAMLLVVAGAFAFYAQERGDAGSRASRQVVAGERAFETWLEDAWIRLEPGSEAVLAQHGARGAVVLLERGDARFSVPPRKQRAPFAVQAGSVRVEVVGTRFRVHRRGAFVRVSDDEGRVRVLSAGESTLLTPGTSWSNTAPKQAELASLGDAGSALAPSSSAGSDQPALGSSGGGGRALAPSSSKPASEGKAPSAAQRRAGTALAAAARREQPPPEGDARVRFERAARLEASEPEQAFELYAALAAAAGPWSEPALYAMGRLAFERGARARAVTLLRSYLRSYPGGENAADVRSLLSKLGASTGEDAR